MKTTAVVETKSQLSSTFTVRLRNDTQIGWQRLCGQDGVLSPLVSDSHTDRLSESSCFLERGQTGYRPASYLCRSITEYRTEDPSHFGAGSLSKSFFTRSESIHTPSCKCSSHVFKTEAHDFSRGSMTGQLFLDRIVCPLHTIVNVLLTIITRLQTRICLNQRFVRFARCCWLISVIYYLGDIWVSVIGISNDFESRDNLSSEVKDILYDKEPHFAPYDG